MKRILVVAATCLSASISAIAQQGLLTITREKVLPKDGTVKQMNLPLFPLKKPAGKVFEQAIATGGGSSARLHFKIDPQTDPEREPWSIVIRDSKNSKDLWTISSISLHKKAEQTKSQLPAEIWSGDLSSDALIVQVISLVANNSLHVLIDKMAVTTARAVPVSIIHNALQPILQQTSNIKGWGKAVVRLRFAGDDGNQYLCTGFLLKPTLLLTNHHCVSTQTEMASALADFYYDSDATSPTVVAFDDLLATDTDLDYSLLRISDLGVSPLTISISEPTSNEKLLIIQHPGGEAKQVSIIGCSVHDTKISGISASLTDFSDECDTKSGSSGSPVQDIATGMVVGLHHLGFNPGGTPVNRAVRIKLVIASILQKRPDLAAELPSQ
jgi:hypothetical protein